MPAVLKEGGWEPALNDLDMAYEPPRHLGGNNFAFVDGHVEWLPFPGGRWIDGGPWVVPRTWPCTAARGIGRRAPCRRRRKQHGGGVADRAVWLVGQGLGW